MPSASYKLGQLALACAGSALLAGCSASRPAHFGQATAPILGDDAPLSSRGGTNPNAPYTTVDHSVHLVTRTAAVDIQAASPCAAGDLSLFESGAQVNGDRRSVRLNLVNHAKEACRLNGYPSISLLGKDGSLIGSVAIEKMTSTTLEGEMHSQAPPKMAGSDSSGLTSGGAPAADSGKLSPYVLLAPGGEATFEVGWTSGANCDQVGSIAVAAPGTVQSFVVRHELTVCEGRILVTAVGDDTEL